MSGSSQEPQTSPIFVENQQGALYQPLHRTREVKIYPIQEHELKTIGVLNFMSSLCVSVAIGALMFMLGVVWDVCATSDGTVKDVGGWFVAACLLIAAAAFGLAGYFQWDRKSELDKILRECKGPPPGDPQGP